MKRRAGCGQGLTGVLGKSHIFRVLKRNPFIIPSAPVLKSEPPVGPQWLHEVKFDGWRAQLHKSGNEIAIFTRQGHDYTKRFPVIRDSVLALRAWKETNKDRWEMFERR